MLYVLTVSILTSKAGGREREILNEYEIDTEGPSYLCRIGGMFSYLSQNDDRCVNKTDLGLVHSYRVAMVQLH